ncbi:MAG: GNAT family N-acetyltransferase [Fastidiosipila sp.]|nr:GNAT family N-acetyltransferase [Fastidiosipila sp.]
MLEDNHFITGKHQLNMFKKKLTKTSLQGERVFIRNLMTKDYDALTRLFADKDVMYYYLPARQQTFSATELEELLADWNDLDTSFVFTVLHEQKPIGIITSESVDFEMEHAEVGIALLSAAERGKGLAFEAMTVFINFLFGDLELHRINARIISGNKDSFKLFERLGFRHEGTQREYVRRGCSYLDMNIFGLLAKDWLQKDCK